MWSALVTLTHQVRQLEIDLEADGQARHIRTPTLFVGNNRLQLEQVGIVQAPALDHDHLVAITSGRLDIASSLRLMLRGFLGSDAKVLSAAAPVRAGLDACDAAAAGLRGPADVLEHPDGFLARFATVPLPDAVTAGLGSRWHAETTSYKVHPGGPGLDAAVDCALELRAALGPLEPGDVETALNAAAQIGDDTLQRKSQGSVVPESFTHGTSAQRVTWFKRGLEGGSVERCNTFEGRDL